MDRLNTIEAAAVLGLSPWTLIKWRQLGKGPTHLKLGGKVVYRQTDLDAFLDDATISATDAAD